jgi:hypothetical protein
MSRIKMRVPHNQLIYGGNTGVTMKEAKRAFLSGMSKNFKKKVKIQFVRR